ncbi:hypothetical protein KR009_010367 [Drosophila setifemur]|nr:hypothetical protein KR009_010367 [Drosophila setifemur]
MLERIDEQTAAMSQRSERLKMMKLQYQMYFAKLVQNQTLRCIQQTTAPSTAGGAIPVLLQPQATLTNPPQPQPTPQPWTFAMATPTQAGMFLTPQFASASGVPVAQTPLPVPTSVPPPNYPAPHALYYPEMYGGVGTPLGTSNLFDLRATLRAFDNENADLPERMHPHQVTGDYQAQELSGAMGMGMGIPHPTGAAATSSTSTSQERGGSGARQLSSTSSTLATSSLTFDKLPKTSSSLTLTELPVTTNAATSAGATSTPGGAAMPPTPEGAMPPTPGGGGAMATKTTGQDVGGQPQREMDDDDLDLEAWTNSRVTKVEYEKSPTVVGHNEPVQQQQQHQQQQHDFEAYFGELKIDEPWQEDKRPLNVRASDFATPGGAGSKVGISNDLLDEVKASRAALERAAAAVDEQLARGNQLSPPVSQQEPLTPTLVPATAAAAASTPNQAQAQTLPKPGVSIENIENAIYGERLTGAASAAAAAPTQGYFENLVTKESQEEEQLQQQQQLEQSEAGGYGQYEASGYSEPSEPLYASIDSNNHPQQSAAVEPLYSEIGNPTDYQAYPADASAVDGTSAPPADAAGGAAAGTGESSGEGVPQEYSNIDYGNYDAAQYGAGYDPNVAYPGYIYDEATGQYIADPSAAQYAPDGSYAGQEYDASAVQNYDYSAYEQQPVDQQQQQQEEQLQQEQQLQEQLQQQEAYPVTESIGQDLAEVEPSPPPEPSNPGPTTNSKPKPTSILSTTTDKQAVPNDAQQQKKKKRVNFVDSSETDDSSSAKPSPGTANPGPVSSASASNPPATATPTATSPGGVAGVGVAGGVAGGVAEGGGSESDFDFSTGSEAKN